MMRLAKLIPKSNGITDIHSQTTYTGGMFSYRDKGGELPIERLYASDRLESRKQKYESILIRMTGGFDD